MNAQNAIAQIEAGLSLEENWRDYDAEKEAIAVLTALVEENDQLKRDLLDAYSAATEKNKEIAALKVSK